jgi:hypothetical protein
MRGGFLIRRGSTIQPQTMNTMTAADQLYSGVRSKVHCRFWQMGSLARVPRTFWKHTPERGIGHHIAVL